jgi:hypothetical protein
MVHFMGVPMHKSRLFSGKNNRVLLGFRCAFQRKNVWAYSVSLLQQFIPISHSAFFRFSSFWTVAFRHCSSGERSGLSFQPSGPSLDMERPATSSAYLKMFFLTKQFHFG